MQEVGSAYFAPLVTLADIITEAGDYVTRAGERVTIEQVSTRHDFMCVGYYHDADRTRDGWHKSGRIYASKETQCDVVARWAGT